MPITSFWNGTFPANTTDTTELRIDINFDRFDTYPEEIAAQEPVQQSEILPGSSKALCGKRGYETYLTAHRSPHGYDCVNGIHPCVTGGGETFCVEDLDECPVTDIRIYDDLDRALAE